LSLGQAIFFGIGAYSIGMHMMLESSGKGVYGEPVPDFMIWNQIYALPLFWKPYTSAVFAIGSSLLLPALLATVIGVRTFRRGLRPEGGDHHAEPGRCAALSRGRGLGRLRRPWHALGRARRRDLCALAPERAHRDLPAALADHPGRALHGGHPALPSRSDWARRPRQGARDAAWARRRPCSGRRIGRQPPYGLNRGHAALRREPHG